jgi:hypothetical protein
VSQETRQPASQFLIRKKLGKHRFEGAAAPRRSPCELLIREDSDETATARAKWRSTSSSSSDSSGPMPASTLESNLATTRGQMRRPGGAHGHAGGAPDGARDGRARDRTREIPALFACVRAARSCCQRSNFARLRHAPALRNCPPMPASQFLI